jgi:hypothetical protein
MIRAAVPKMVTIISPLSLSNIITSYRRLDDLNKLKKFFPRFEIPSLK